MWFALERNNKHNIFAVLSKQELHRSASWRVMTQEEMRALMSATLRDFWEVLGGFVYVLSPFKATMNTPKEAYD